MKMRRLLAVLALGLFAVLGTAGAAYAQEGEGEVAEEEHGEFADHAAEECAHILAEGGDVDECQEAPSPILPATNELIWGGISFLVLLLLMWKFALPGLKKAMEDRTERIRKDVEEAEQIRSEADRIREDYSRQLADAKSEAARIIEEARQAADSVRRDLTQRAEQEAAELRQRNADQLESERARIMSELQGQVATLAIELAEKVVESNLDRAANERLIESYIQQVGNR